MRGASLLTATLLLVSLLGVSSCGVQEAGNFQGHSDVQGGDGVHGGSDGAQGSGDIRTEDRPVQGFSRIKAATFGTLTITQSGSESLSIEADDNILPLLTSEVRNGTLELGVRPNTWISNAHIAYTVTVKSLDEVELSGSGDARLVGIDTGALRISISGSGGVTSSGRAGDQRVQISGSGDYDGSDTGSKTATVDINGSGEAVLKVSDTLDVDINGSGDVEYIGDPAVNQDISGSGTVRRRG
jgi:hypothetical protein